MLIPGFWAYVFDGNGWRNRWCRFRGHPHGVWWYAPAPALDPDMHCQDCGENLG